MSDLIHVFFSRPIHYVYFLAIAYMVITLTKSLSDIAVFLFFKRVRIEFKLFPTSLFVIFFQIGIIAVLFYFWVASTR